MTAWTLARSGFTTCARVWVPFLKTANGSKVRPLSIFDRTSATDNPQKRSASLRANLDPEEKASEADLWDAVDGVGMKAHVEAMVSLER